MERAYSNPPESKSENLNPPTQTAETSAGQIARDLRELCAMGLLEKFRDERGITRYRPTGRLA
jgi:hypothetical protein